MAAAGGLKKQTTTDDSVQIVSTLGQDPEINLVSLSRAKQWFVPK